MASLFCEHKKLRSTCFVCGSTKSGPVPARGPVSHDPDDTWRALRLECHARFCRFLEAVRAGTPSDEAYFANFTKPSRQVKTTSEEEDPTTFVGAHYWAMVKMFDVSVEGRRIQGYNGLTDWDEMRDYVFRKYDPETFASAIKEGTLTIHGGSGAWPRQQISCDIIRSPRLQEAVMAVVYGDDGRMPGELTDEDAVARLAAAARIAQEEGITIGALQFASKLLHVFAPAKWPAITARSTPEVADAFELELAPVVKPEDYAAFTSTLRAHAKAEGHADFIATDIAFAAQYDAMQDDDEDFDAADLDK